MQVYNPKNMFQRHIDYVTVTYEQTVSATFTFKTMWCNGKCLKDDIQMQVNQLSYFLHRTLSCKFPNTAEEFK